MRREVIQRVAWLAVMAAVLATAGCGFKLRGQALLPFNSVYIDAASGSPVARLLTQSLKESGKKVLARPDHAEIRVLLADEHYIKDILALSGGGKVAEYRLYYRLTLTVLNHSGQQVLAPTLLQATRDYSYSDQELLAKQREEADLIRDMQHEILRQVLSRLSFIGHP
jgi:LPS-assembly lipoprotein